MLRIDWIWGITNKFEVSVACIRQTSVLQPDPATCSAHGWAL